MHPTPAPTTTEHSDPGPGVKPPAPPDIWADLVDRIRAWSQELGLGAIGIADLEVTQAAQALEQWLAAGRHGDMEYLQRQAALRARPAHLQAGALRVISARLDYRPRNDTPQWREREQQRLRDGQAAVVSIYARGRDYHKVLRGRLRLLGERIGRAVQQAPYRPYCDSAPLLEVELARKAGLGWRGKHTLLLARDAGSMFFLGELLTDLPLPVDIPRSAHCGNCTRCLEACPTQAITAPYSLDARRCISYLTIEHRGSIPEPLRRPMGNRVYGCDDCQLVCPWNRYAQCATLADFDVRHGLDRASLVELFAWSAAQFRQRHAGSAILRIGYVRWLRNLAVGLGNAPGTAQVVAALRARQDHPAALVREHVAWALEQHGLQ